MWQIRSAERKTVLKKFKDMVAADESPGASGGTSGSGDVVTNSAARGRWASRRICPTEAEEDEPLDAAAQQAVRVAAAASRAERVGRRAQVHDQIAATAS